VHLELAETGADGREHRLVPEAAAAWQRMKHAALEAGVRLCIVSAYRSVDRQVEIIRRKLAAARTSPTSFAFGAAGFSEHTPVVPWTSANRTGQYWKPASIRRRRSTAAAACGRIRIRAVLPGGNPQVTSTNLGMVLRWRTARPFER